MALLAALLLLASAATHAQTAQTARLRAVYQLEYRLDSTVATPKRVRMILRVSNGFSRFQSVGLQQMDSVYASLAGADEQVRNQKSMEATRKGGKNEFQYTVLKEPAKNFVAYHDLLFAEPYQYQDRALLFAWSTTSAQKLIAGHACQQAFTTFGGRTWEAWFARDVPVSDGPYKFYGLPGLILEVRDTQSHYVFSLLCLDTTPQPFDAAADPGAPISARQTAPVLPKKKFLQVKFNDDLTFVDRMAAVGNQIPEILRQQHLERLKSCNNPLERR